MTFYKIKKRGHNLDDPYWVTKSINEFGEIWVNLRGGWCMKAEYFFRAGFFLAHELEEAKKDNQNGGKR